MQLLFLMAKVFFGCSMLGGHDRVSRDELARIPDIIEGLGHKLASRHQTRHGIIEEENQREKPEIHDRDYAWEIESDMGIFEISNPSLGAGGEISDMVHMGKPVMCLFKRGLEEIVSNYIQGKQGSRFIKSPFECHTYETLEELKEKIRGFVETHSNAV
jgi:hypothetical protein